MGRALADLEIPSHVLLAKDDPIIPIADVDALLACIERDVVRLWGHCGFLDRYGRENWTAISA